MNIKKRKRAGVAPKEKLDVCDYSHPKVHLEKGEDCPVCEAKSEIDDLERQLVRAENDWSRLESELESAEQEIAELKGKEE